jgi:signal transduction histidine kinase
VSWIGRRASRVPLRLRLVAGFVATMLVLLTGAAAFVYWRVQYSLDRNLDSDLQRSANALAPLVTDSGELPKGDTHLTTLDGVQVLGADGTVLSHHGELHATSALPPAAVQEAARAPILRDRGALFDPDAEVLRFYATPLHPAGAGGRSPAVLVVALSREQHDAALRELLGQLTASVIVTLVLTAIVGDLLARAALRPVETYRRQATDIAEGATTLRLDVPAERDDEITRLGHTLNDMLDALGRALERERRFINDASHELRTPLTRITSRVQLTLRRPRTVAEHERALEEIRHDLTRLTALADELLTLGAAGDGADSSCHLATDLAGVVRKVTSQRTTLAPAGSPYHVAGAVSIESAGQCPVDVDPVRLERIVDNLLDNAALHGATPVGVTVECVEGADPADAGPWVRLVVRDSGPGMSPDLLATATERFARAPEARSRAGSGLGLALVTTLVESANGELRLCYAGRHRSTGKQVPVACGHDDAMTVTVLLPAAAERPDVTTQPR